MAQVEMFLFGILVESVSFNNLFFFKWKLEDFLHIKLCYLVKREHFTFSNVDFACVLAHCPG